MEKRWMIKNQGYSSDIEHLSEVLHIDTIIANLLVQRGIKNYEEAKTFFRPHLSQLFDPFLMKDMDRATERIEKAISMQEKILIFGDYDADGTTAVAMMYSFIKKRTPNVIYYIPDRYEEGYGISIKGIDYAFDNDCTLIVALDCGIKDNDKVEYANTLNIDFIICDHHNPGNSLPKAKAILNPKRNDCIYPFKELSGCGIGFKLLHALSIKYNLPVDENYKIAEELISYLDLVTVSIASDIVPIVNENRILVYYGLKMINENPRIGIKSIIDISRLDKKEVEVNDIVFRIGPRINAAGRIESGQRSVDLLICSDKEEADKIALEIDNHNETRKNIDLQITEEAIKIIDSDEILKNRKTTVLFNPAWHKGVIGIVASRVMETYYKPTILLTEHNGLATGSARSVQGFDIYSAINACSDLLENFGGHTYAAGLSMKVENVPLFQEKFEEVVSKTIDNKLLIQQIEVDTKLRLNDITPKLYRIIKQFRPFGPENMKPVFISEFVHDKGTGRIVGKEREHLKLDIMEGYHSDRIYPAIAFNQANHFETIKYRIPFNICYSLEENEFMGNVTLQIKVRDIKPVKRQHNPQKFENRRD
ncbi:MAG: single-stranded-DNA-specific exonuclease RecJ [Bacteroidia bacterium]|nr:single-stranded-DNA-specific exonuclease RecJ [Bacteroidia bacterium]